MNKRLLVPIAGICSAVAWGPATAQQSATLEEIVVTASRRAEALQDTPMSVAVVSQTDIDRQGLENLNDLARGVPGLAVTEQGPGLNRVFIRGISNPNSLTSQVGVYVDETSVASPSIAQLDLQLVDLERVEVLRGPQGTLYGQGSAGGTVRFITRRPDLGEFSGNAALSAYFTDGGDPSQKLTGTLNVPLIEDQLGLRISGTFGNLGGWVDQPDSGRSDINDQDLRNLRVKGLWRITPEFEIEASAIVHRNESDGVSAGADRNYDLRYLAAPANSRPRIEDDYGVYNLTATYAFRGASLMSSTSLVESDKLSVGLRQGFPGLGESFFTDDFENRTITQELRLTSTAEGPFNWVVGAFYADESVERLLVNEFYLVGGIRIGAFPIPAELESKSYSVYGDVNYRLTPKLTLGAGVRYFEDDRSDVLSRFEATFDSVDPRVYLTYEATDALTLYANVAKGFRSGGFNTTGTTFEPEKVLSYELGARGSYAAVRWELTGYFADYSDYQSFLFPPPPAPGGLLNGGDAEAYGVEYLLEARPTQNLTLLLTGAFNEAELVSVKPGAVANVVGDPLDFVPEYTVTASAEYGFDWSGARPGFARVDYNQIGKRTFTDRSAQLVRIPSDTLGFLNARLGIEFAAFTVELFGENLLDEVGDEDPFGKAVLGNVRPRPRTFGINLRADF